MQLRATHASHATPITQAPNRQMKNKTLKKLVPWKQCWNTGSNALWIYVWRQQCHLSMYKCRDALGAKKETKCINYHLGRAYPCPQTSLFQNTFPLSPSSLSFKMLKMILCNIRDSNQTCPTPTAGWHNSVLPAYCSSIPSSEDAWVKKKSQLW